MKVGIIGQFSEFSVLKKIGQEANFKIPQKCYFQHRRFGRRHLKPNVL